MDDLVFKIVAVVFALGGLTAGVVDRFDGSVLSLGTGLVVGVAAAAMLVAVLCAARVCSDLGYD